MGSGGEFDLDPNRTGSGTFGVAADGGFMICGDCCGPAPSECCQEQPDACVEILPFQDPPNAPGLEALFTKLFAGAYGPGSCGTWGGYICWEYGRVGAQGAIALLVFYSPTTQAWSAWLVYLVTGIEGAFAEGIDLPIHCSAGGALVGTFDLSFESFGITVRVYLNTACETLGYYALLACDGSAEPIYTNEAWLADYVGQAVKIEGSSLCWLVARSSTAGSTSITLVTAYEQGCQGCEPYSNFRLADCAEVEADILSSTADLVNYVGRVVKISGSTVCWLVAPYWQAASTAVTVLDSWPSCEDCLAPPSSDCAECEGTTPPTRVAVVSGVEDWETVCNCQERPGSGLWYKRQVTDPNDTYLLEYQLPHRCTWLRYQELNDTVQLHANDTCTDLVATEYLGRTAKLIQISAELAHFSLWDRMLGGDPRLSFVYFHAAIFMACGDTGEWANDVADCGYGWFHFISGRAGSVTISPGESPFCQTLHCTSRAHCRTCRDLEAGRPWRERLRKAFELPDDKTDFDCLHGVPWGYQPPRESPAARLTGRAARSTTPGPRSAPGPVAGLRAAPDVILQREELCEDCPQHNGTGRWCRLGLPRCALGRPASRCPDDPPRWGPVEGPSNAPQTPFKESSNEPS